MEREKVAVPTNMGRRLSEQIAIYDGLDVGVYDVVDTIDIKLGSSISDEIEPVAVPWTLVEFTGEQAQLQMNTD